MDIQFAENIQKTLRKLGVVAVYLFGSRAQGVAGELSDYDFAILTKESGYKRGEALYDRLYELLSPLCPRTFPYDIIDIVFLDTVSLELQMHVVRNGRVLFDADPFLRTRFEITTMLKSADFAPLRRAMSKALLARI